MFSKKESNALKDYEKSGQAKLDMSAEDPFEDFVNNVGRYFTVRLQNPMERYYYYK